MSVVTVTNWRRLFLPGVNEAVSEKKLKWILRRQGS